MAYQIKENSRFESSLRIIALVQLARIALINSLEFEIERSHRGASNNEFSDSKNSLRESVESFHERSFASEVVKAPPAVDVCY